MNLAKMILKSDSTKIVQAIEFLEKPVCLTYPYRKLKKILLAKNQLS